MDYSNTAAGVLKGVGGEENVQSLVHCMTRLRFVLKDESKADDQALRAVPGVITTARAGGQYQVVIGNDVPEVYAAIGKISALGSSGGAVQEEPKKDKNLFNRFIEMISAIFTPLLWALAGTGLLKAFLAATVTFGWISNTTSTYTILNALSDAFINFLPMALAITAARHFKASEFTSFAIAGALVYPSIVALNGHSGITFFGIPVVMVSYVSSVIPIVIIVWLQSFAERYLYAKLPAAIRRFVTPMIIILIAVPLVFLVIGPLSSVLSNGLASGITWVFKVAPWLGGALLGGLWQVLVIFGLHWGFVPIMTVEYQTTGSITLAAPLFAAVLAQAGAVAGVWVRARKQTLKSLAAPATLSGFLAGITEPAIYGINLPLKRPFAFGIVGGVLGGAIISAGGIRSNSFVVPSLLSSPALFGQGNMFMLGLGVLVAVVVAFVLTVVFGFDESLVGAAAPSAGTQPTSPDIDTQVYSPVDGTVIALSEVPDAAFASGQLGQGLAVQPRGGAVYAPFDGEVIAAFPTGHAVGLRSASGTEVLIHIGIDTVKLNGKHFELMVQKGQHVTLGQLLVEFDAEAISAAGFALVTPVVVTNSKSFTVAQPASGPIAHGDNLYLAVAAEPATASV
ncbi:PTS system, beta-glucosides-specific IIC component [Propionibacterium cyclohexanicum]|uniref:PTS system, beta-glucosides-specific IIC component n=1 Tax=Propionibacterium cyclohexanicum TaxID=64702 RepID=A0A1H9S202_9ACTN|nr:beta-glucoside-specific PTS transporter subunit IIABC [Propionibacterium cyclohexanicum]SER78169.1 PTS system, beta-glucosides-specific IIC component [Propionibacterium cyclohexanicum]